MIRNRISKVAGTATLVAGLFAAGPASAVISYGPGGDTLLNGAFNQMGFGVAGKANITPLLYVGDFAATDPARQAVQGTDLSFDYHVLDIGSPVVTVQYSVTNGGFDAFTDLRLFVSTRAKGDPAALDLATAHGFGSPPAAGDPSQFQIYDVGLGDPIGLIRSASNLAGSSNCGGAGCLPEMALQWNKASIAGGETWTVSFLLTDDPSLAGSGRYLQSSSLGNGQSLIFGNPVPVPEPGTYALLFAGLGMLALTQRRRRALA
jgi:hypothetical protein